MSKIIITGASGFIGSNLSRKLLNSKDEINVFIRKESNLWRLNDIINNLNTHFVDLSDDEKVWQKIKEIKPDIVFHCVTYGVNHSQNDLKIMIQTNVINSIKLMESCVEYNDLERFVNIGSSREYGPKINAIKETDNVAPTTTYGITKAAQTFFTNYFRDRKNLPAVTLRVFNTYGKFQESGHLISDILIALVTKKPLTLSASKARRDFVYIDDIVDALIKAGKQPEIEGMVFNIGIGKEFSVQDIINLVPKINELEINWIDKKESDPARTEGRGFADIEKSKRMLDWSPKHSLQDGLSQTYNWFKENIRLYQS